MFTPRTGSYSVHGLGARKRAVLAAGGNTLDLAIAMLETERMTADYPPGDGKTGDEARYGIFKQNWLMIRSCVREYAELGPAAHEVGATLNTNLRFDIQVLHASQKRWGLARWFGGHRRGQAGLDEPVDVTTAAYRTAVDWIREQINANEKYRSDDTRFWAGEIGA